MALEDIVNVNVTTATATVSQKGFGTPLVYAYHNHFAAKVREYKKSSWAASMVADGFSTTSPAYLGVKSVFNQSPSPKSCKVGKKTTAQTQVVWLTPTVGGGTFEHTVSIEEPDGTVYEATYSEDGSGTVAEICTGLAAAINATATTMTASGVSGTHIVLTSDSSNVVHSIYGLSETLTLTDHSTTSGDSDDLTAIYAADSDWYALLPATSAPTTIEACADWAESMPVIHIASTHDQGCLDDGVTDDIMSSLHDQNYARSAVVYHSRAAQFAGAAWAGCVLPDEPGAATWKFKQLRGVTVDAITGDQESAVTAKAGNWYSRVAGVPIMSEGTSASGEFIDVTQVSDWLSARIKESVFGTLAAAKKVPFSVQGAAQLYGAIKRPIDLGIRNNALLAFNDDGTQAWTIDVPLPSEVPDEDRAARKWSGITASAKISGAVHKVDTINVFLST